MSLEQALQIVPTFVLAFFRLAALCLSAPLFGSAKVPRRVKVFFALVLAAAIAPTLQRVTRLPDDAWQLAVGIGGEIVYGLAMGTALSLVFIAINWAGQIMGQQMGMNMSEVFDPQYGQGGSIVGDLLFMLTLVIFLLIRGHHALLRGVYGSFESLPLLSAGMSRGLLDLLVGLVNSATMLALQLAAPMLITMLVVDLVLGFLGKTVPQFNLMSAGLSLRSGIGMVVLIVGVALTSDVVRQSLLDNLDAMAGAWRGLPAN